MTAGTVTGWVLFVSCDETTMEPLARQCRRERLGAAMAATAEEAAQTVRSRSPDVVALDVDLPDEDGFDVLRRFRETWDVPVILLAENREGLDEVVGLTLGADDVVPRSVLPRLFVARVKALLRRTRTGRRHTTYRLGVVELDPGQIRATVNGEPVELTLSEFRLLEVLARVTGTPLSRRQLLVATSPEGGALERTVDVHVSNIRRKLARHGVTGLLETVRGVGYRARPPIVDDGT